MENAKNQKIIIGTFHVHETTNVKLNFLKDKLFLTKAGVVESAIDLLHYLYEKNNGDLSFRPSDTILELRFNKQ